MDFKKLKKEIARDKRAFEARYNKSFNPISDLVKGQAKLILIDPHKNIGARICPHCFEEIDATRSHICDN